MCGSVGFQFFADLVVDGSGRAWSAQRTLGARLRDRTATQRSKKGSEKVLGRVLGKGSQKGS